MRPPITKAQLAELSSVNARVKYRRAKQIISTAIPSAVGRPRRTGLHEALGIESASRNEEKS